MKKVLLVTDGLVHPPLTARHALGKVLEQMEGFTFSRVRSLEKLPADLETYSAMVIYHHHQKLSDAALARLDDFVSNGGGLLGVHSATAAYKGADHYFEILGGRFIGHGPVEKFTVAPVGRTDVFTDIPAFDVVDELYIHDTQPGIEVHFTASYQGEDIPVVWTYAYGKGRVCYAVPGHRTASIKHQAYQKLLQQGLRWAADA